MVEADEIERIIHAEAAHNFKQDEIAPTRSPITGKIYTSAAQLRAEYRSHGYTEAGNAFANGHRVTQQDPTTTKRAKEALRRSIWDKLDRRVRD